VLIACRVAPAARRDQVGRVIAAAANLEDHMIHAVRGFSAPVADVAVALEDLLPDAVLPVVAVSAGGLVACAGEVFGLAVLASAALVG
jgi:hypothetical protein